MLEETAMPIPLRVQFEVTRDYVQTKAARLARRVVDDERGSATAEQIVMIAAAVVAAAGIAAVIWSKMSDGANNIQTPAP